MKQFRLLTLAILLAFGFSAEAQVYLERSSPDTATLTFKDLQRQFGSWKKDKDLSKHRYWKYFKRLEMEMQLHTDGRGNPADPAIYFREAHKVIREKQAATNSRFTNAWYPVGPNAVPNNQTGYMENGVGRINCIAFHPTSPSTYFVGVAQGGVWKTTNNGQTWLPLTDNLPITRISDIAIDPNNTNTMYISVCDYAYIGAGLFLDGRKRNTHYGLGVYKTTDGGLTWNPTGLSFQQTNRDASLIKKILVNPTNSNNLVACGVSGMYVSLDGGVTWAKNVNNLFWDLVQHPANPNTLYAASGWVRTANIGQAGIYKSTDFGTTWTLLTTNIPQTGTVQRIKLAIAPSDPNYVYALAVNTLNGMHGLYKTANGGTTWQFINPGLNVLEAGNGNNSGGQGNYDLALLVSTTNRDLLYTGGVNIWGSTDGGQSFNPVSHWTTGYGPTLHGDIQFMERQPGTGNIFVCNDGGLYRTSAITISTWAAANGGTPWPTQWTNISNGMAITSFYRLASSKDLSERLVAGAQDNATFYYNGANWQTIFGGDGMDNFLLPNNPNMVFGSWQYGSLRKTTDGGLTSFSASPGVSGEVGEWTTPIIADYNQPNVIYTGYENVYKSTNAGNSWSSISNFPRGFNATEISALAVANSNNNVLVAARRVRYEYALPGSVFRTANGGTTWTDITAGLPDSLYYTSVEIGENGPNVTYVTMAGFSAGNKVFKTTNGGSTWQNISFNLPNIPVNCLKYIPGKNYVMVATDLGVYVLENGTTTWVNQSQGLPNVIVTDIEFNPAVDKVYVSTFGRGIWATDLNVFVSGAKKPLLAEAKMELYPSPNKGSFTLKFSDEKAARETYKLEIIDVTGKVVHQTNLTGKTEYPQQLQLPAGLYFAKITGPKTFGVKRFVVE